VDDIVEWSAVSVACRGLIPVEKRGIEAGGRILLYVGPG